MWTSPPSVEDKRFLLLSPSLRDRVGHYHDYAARLLDAASCLGYQAHLAAHRTYRDSDGRPFAPIFRRTCGENQQGGAARAFGPDRWQRILGGLIHRAPEPDASATPAAPSAGRGRLRSVFQAWRQAADRLADALSIRDFARDLEQVVGGARLTDRDLILLADAGVAEVRGLARFLRGRAEVRGAWSVVLRRDVTEQHDARGSPGAWAAALQALVKAGQGRVRLYSDTEGLAALYGQLARMPVGLLPIPVAASPRQPAAAAFTAVYLGDARDEKGFPLLARAILAMAAERRDSVAAFALQSHFNVAGGDAATARARDLLAAAGPGVSLIDTPLDAIAYGRLIGAADVVLMPYDPIAYRFRSSGVMTEALATGAPVLVTAGSWMAQQIQPAEQAHLATLRDRLEPLAVTDGAVEAGDGVVLEIRPLDGPGRVEVALDGADGTPVMRQARDIGDSLLLLVRSEGGPTSLRAAPGAVVRISGAWRAPADTPAGALGVIVDNEARAIADGLRELIRFRRYYRAAAQAAAGDWARTHSGQALVARLAADAATA